MLDRIARPCFALSFVALSACNTPTPPADTGSGFDAGVIDANIVDANIDTSPDAGPGPDLTVDTQQLASNIQFARQYFSPTSCELAEMCVTGSGWRTLLMFTTFTPNIGTADLMLGSNTYPDGGTNAGFEYSTCHMHYHFRGYADYTLLHADGSVAAIGHKQSFCVEDLQRVDTLSPGVRATALYGNCGDGTSQQGISRGWADDYYPDLPCQWIDVTDVPAGTYTLNVAVNTLRGFRELDYSNNSAHATVVIPADYAVGADPTSACGALDPQQGIGRNCGWVREGVHTCTAGQHISVGCNATCGVGSCDANSYGYDVRICRGDHNCRSADAVNLVTADSGACGGAFNLVSVCGVARFDCPVEGMYTVLYTQDQQGDPTPLSGCHLATVVR